ncbi:MAG: hypothetical protein GY929_06485 [Actinomycetia bacterium]|nr:hypothetical protein [Actinomycetes bacterium]
MSTSVDAVALGRPATTALAAAITDAKQAGPLTPVTVIVPSNLAGLSVRRLLGSMNRGIANVDFLTPFRLAELVAADQLGDSRPLTNPVLGAAVRRALADDPGPFGPVADHHATQAALAALYAELSTVSAAALGRIEQGGAPASVRLYRSIAGHLDGFHDEAALTRAAADRPHLASALEQFGQLVWFLPEAVAPPLAGFLRTVFAASPPRVLVGVTGHPEADAPVWAAIAAAGITRPPETISISPSIADVIVSVTDADEEVRAVVRRVVEWAERGVRLDRIGVFYPAADPYQGVLDQQLAAAGLPANGPSRRRLAHSVPGRTLLAALSLPAQRWRRDRVLALASSAPLRFGDQVVRPSAWETISRQAGVIQDMADWRRKLSAHQHWLDSQLTDLDLFSRHDKVERVQRQSADVASLLTFLEQLNDLVGAVERAEGWPARTGAAVELLHSLMGPGHLHSTWPEAEQVAFDRVEDVLARLATLDELEPVPPMAVFVRALEAELDVSRGRNGRFGQGVVYGPLVSAGGHDLDAVFVLGCAEGLLPAPRREDSLLSDEVRALAGGELELGGARLHQQHRQFLAALAAAPAGGRVLTFPRGDLRGSRQTLPSRWLLDTASVLAGHTVHTTDFGDLAEPVVEVVPSHHTGIAAASTPASLVERDLAVVARHVDGGGSPLDLPSARRVGRAICAQHERRSGRFTEWDGNLAGQSIPSSTERPLSPSRLESWATCGYRFFMGDVLGLNNRDNPERNIDLEPVGRGTAVHDILEQFIGEAIQAGPPDPHEPWSADGRARLRAIANTVFADTEARGLTGRTLHWDVQRSELLTQLLEFIERDNEHRSATRSRPYQVEFAFGLDGSAPVRLELVDGRQLQFRGRVDRIDRDVDGRFLVSDYKTGSGTRYQNIDEGDPVQAGTTLQLGLYAEAARQLLGAVEVSTHYWIVGAGRDPGRHGYDWTPERRQRLLEVVGAIADGIEAGVFPVVPGDWNTWRSTHDNCTYCAFDRVCGRNRGEQAKAKAGAPELVVRDPLVIDGGDEVE